MIKSLTIANYKGFYDSQKIEFATPDSHNPGSGLTLIIGPNNTGKTTVVEALLIGPDRKFKESERHTDTNPLIKIENATGITTEYTNTSNGSLVEVSGGDHGIKFELIPSRRMWSHQFNGEWEFSSLIYESSQGDVRSSGGFNLGPILKKILKTSSLKNKFNTYLKEIIPHFSDWTIDTNDAGQDYIKYKTGSTFHQANLLGDGIISLFRIVAHLTHTESSTFIIDEPELSLHPAAQKRLASVISALSANKQIIVCTHSPYFVDWSDFINGAKFVRLNKPEDKKCTTSGLYNTKDYSTFISRNIDEFQRPQLLDTTAKEILFCDQILFTEGQEDVGLIKKWFKGNSKALSFDIFGYGVGGETNMRLFLEMAKDLQIEKVAALYDSNATTLTADQETYPTFLLRALNTEDIRDKVNKCTNDCPYGKNREGTFDSKGLLKSDKKTFFDALMNEYTTYFNS